MTKVNRTPLHDIRESLVIDDFLDSKTLEAIEYYYRDVYFGWKSDRRLTFDLGHWSKYITARSKALTLDTKLTPFFKEDHYYINAISEKIESIIGKRGIIRCYYKHYTYGTDAYIHKDVSHNAGWDSECETAILYLTKDWDPQWYGMTNLYDESGYEVYKSVMPKYNRLFIFDGRQFHSATPLSRACGSSKKILVFNYMPVDKTDDAFLFIEKNTKDLPHGDKTLFEHLYNTYKFLDMDRKVPNFVAKAGLFHSIYGTDYYHATKDLNISRYTVRDLIGEEAEDLAYKFCTMKNRTEAIIEGDDIWLKKIELCNYRDQHNFPRSDRVDYVIKTLSEQIEKENLKEVT